MMSVNRVLLIGRVWEKPILLKTKHSVSVATFEITTIHRHRDVDGKVRTFMQRHPVRTYAGLAEIAGRLSPRQTVLIEGRLSTVHEPGAKHGETTIIAGTVLPMMDGPAEPADDGDHQADQQPAALTPNLYHAEEGS